MYNWCTQKLSGFNRRQRKGTCLIVSGFQSNTGQDDILKKKKRFHQQLDEIKKGHAATAVARQRLHTQGNVAWKSNKLLFHIHFGNVM